MIERRCRIGISGQHSEIGYKERIKRMDYPIRFFIASLTAALVILMRLITEQNALCKMGKYWEELYALR